MVVRQLEPIMRVVRRMQLVIGDGREGPTLLDRMLYRQFETWKAQRPGKIGPVEVGARDVQPAHDAWADVDEVDEFSVAHNSNCIGRDADLLR